MFITDPYCEFYCEIKLSLLKLLSLNAATTFMRHCDEILLKCLCKKFKHYIIEHFTFVLWLCFEPVGVSLAGDFFSKSTIEIPE